MKSIKRFNYVCLLIIFLISFFSVTNQVLALGELNSSYLSSINSDRVTPPVVNSLKIVNSKDIVLVTITPGTNKLKGIKVGTSLSSSRWYEINTDKTGQFSMYVSMMNGKQNVWAVDTAGNHSTPYQIEIVNSCNEEGSVTNGKGKGYLNKCIIYTNGQEKLAYPGSITCAAGYVLQSEPGISTTCAGITQSNLDQFNLTDRYCSIKYFYNCIQESPKVIVSNLNSLSISSGTLSPAFKAETTEYTANVNVSTLTINATLNSDGSSFVEGYGPRTVKLNYGANTIQIKVKSSTGNIKVYTIKVNRADNRSKDNTLSSLSTNVGTLNPKFNKSTTTYSINVDQGVSSIDIKAVLSDSKASFVNGYGPRTVSLKEGNNKVYIKIKSEAQATKTYTLNITRAKKVSDDPVNPPGGEDPVIPPTVDESTLSLLESLELSEGNLSFNPNEFEYTIYVNYEVTQVVTSAKAKNPLDKITVSGGENLEVAVESHIVITVYNEENKYTRTYTVNVIRKEEEIVVSSNSKLASLDIKNHKIKFDKENYEYKITLGKEESELEIEAKPEDEKSTISIDGNTELDVGSKVVITVTAEDGSVSTYTLEVTKRKKGTNIFLVLILILIAILVIAYMVLRLLGYKIYINFSLIGSFFRSIGEKIRNIFDRK